MRLRTSPSDDHGDATVGQELTADSGTWTNTPASYAYQWQRCDLDASVCFDVGGATGKTYGVRTPTSATASGWS